jgi:hypothetical protein
MCTVTFVRASEGYILTFNRDEVVERSSSMIVHNKEKGLYYPKDVQHGGTWFGFQPSKNKFVCLLNGAFKIHNRIPPYRKSRGLITLEVFDFPSVESFIKDYDLNGIEPFTMLLNEGRKSYELRWDGEEKHIKTIDNYMSMYSSCTLYDEDASQLRRSWLDQFISDKDGQFDETDLWQFHQSITPKKEDISIMMYRANGPQTVSTCQLVFDNKTDVLDFKFYEVNSKKLQTISVAVPQQTGQQLVASNLA